MSIKCNTCQTGRSRAMVSIFFRSNATITYFDMSINCNTFRMLSIKCNACNSCVDQVHYYLKESIKCLRGVIFVDQEPQLVVGCRSSALEVSRSSATLSKRSIKCNAFKNRSSAQPQSRSSASCPLLCIAKYVAHASGRQEPFHSTTLSNDTLCRLTTCTFLCTE